MTSVVSQENSQRKICDFDSVPTTWMNGSLLP
jgi:hypothetical protein